MNANPLRKQYRITFELSLFCSLVFVTACINLLSFDSRTRSVHYKFAGKDYTVIDLTDHSRKFKPVPVRPVIPVASNNEELLDDETVDSTEIDPNTVFNLTAAVPTSPVSDSALSQPFDFIIVEEQPEITGGHAMILKNLKYPEMARMAKIEGTTVIRLLLDEQGGIISAESLSGEDTFGFSKAAIDAILKCEFKPAKQRMKPVKCYMTIPVKFRLR